jgi:DNA-binding transcriptional LysR family regulator
MGARPTCVLASASSALPTGPGDAVSPGLSIATTHTQARYVLPSILCRFRELHLHLPIHLRQGDSGQIPELIARGEAHIAIASGTDPTFASMLRVPCFRWRRVIVTPESHPLAYVSQPTLAQLADYPLITYTPRRAAGSAAWSAGRRPAQAMHFASRYRPPGAATQASLSTLKRKRPTVWWAARYAE